MPIDKYNQKDLISHLYQGMGVVQKVTLLKRGPDQQQGTVTSFTLFGCRRGVIQRHGQTLDGKQSTNSRVTWHVPFSELKRNGIDYLTALDRIVDTAGGTGTWQPEANTKIHEKLIRTHCDVDCMMVNP
jgi:hypothetical protein